MSQSTYHDKELECQKALVYLQSCWYWLKCMHSSTTSQSHPSHIPVTSQAHPVTSQSHPIHIPFTSQSHPIHIPFTSQSHPIHIPFTSHSHPRHIQSHPSHIPFTHPRHIQSHPSHIPFTHPSHIPGTSQSHPSHIPGTSQAPTHSSGEESCTCTQWRGRGKSSRMKTFMCSCHFVMTGRRRATGHDWKEEGYWT